MRHLTRFRDLAPAYRGFIVDLWGVLHDGVTPYDGAVDCMRQLRRTGARVLLLSNAPRRSAAAQAAMRAIGIPDDLYDALLTSGEATFLALRDRDDPWFARLGKRVYHIGPERDRNVIDGIDVTRAADPAEADFVLNTGPDDERDPTEFGPFEAELHACFSAGLPMICANPDLVVIRAGVRVLCAGALAEHYARWGGDVRWIGKPDSAIYATALDWLGSDRGHVLAVGDSLRTDIAGAATAGLDACWVLGGIHADEIGTDPVRIEAAAQVAGQSPVATVPRFVW